MAQAWVDPQAFHAVLSACFCWFRMRWLISARGNASIQLSLVLSHILFSLALRVPFNLSIIPVIEDGKCTLVYALYSIVAVLVLQFLFEC